MVREFSQYEVNSQTFYESQSQTFYEDQLQQQLQSPNVLHDFQAEFLKCMFTADDIECMATNARAKDATGQSHDYDSQTDVETIVQTYMTGNPNWNENVALKVSKMCQFICKCLLKFSILCIHRISAIRY